jgi:hypothetical protein
MKKSLLLATSLLMLIAASVSAFAQSTKVAPNPAQINVDAPLLPVVASVRCRDGVIEVSFKDNPSEWVKTATRSCGSIPTPPPGQKWVCDEGCSDSHGCTWCCRGHYTKGDVRATQRKKKV